MNLKLSFFVALTSVAVIAIMAMSDYASAQSSSTAKVLAVSAFDGRNSGENYTGAWVSISGARVNGTLISKSTFAFEFSGAYNGEVKDIGLSSRRTIASLSAGVSLKTNHPDLGNRYWINQHSIPNIRRLIKSLNREDQEAVYVICDLMARPEFVSNLVGQMISDRSSDAEYTSYWQKPSRVSEAVSLGRSCMRQLDRLINFPRQDQAVAATQVNAAAGTATEAVMPANTADQTRLAQSILKAMRLYTAAVDGVAGPSTSRAIAEGMLKLNVSAEPTAANFLAAAVERLQAQEKAENFTNTTTEIAELEATNTNLQAQLGSVWLQLSQTEAELSKTKQALASAQVATNGGSSSPANARDEVNELKARIAELEAGLEKAKVEQKKGRLDVPDTTIADPIIMNPEPNLISRLEQEIEVLTGKNSELERFLAAANKTIADIRQGIETDARVIELKRQLAAANATIAELTERLSAAEASGNQLAQVVKALQTANDGVQSTLLERERQLSAANESVADLRQRMETDFVPRNDVFAAEAEFRKTETNLREQLSASNQTVADLREKTQTDYVPRIEFKELQRVQAATNQSLADLRNSLETEFKPLEDYQQLERQLAALNSTILELQDRNEVQRNRMIESEALFQNFREDCAGVKECARAMRLE